MPCAAAGGQPCGGALGEHQDLHGHRGAPARRGAGLRHQARPRGARRTACRTARPAAVLALDSRLLPLFPGRRLQGSPAGNAEERFDGGKEEAHRCKGTPAEGCRRLHECMERLSAHRRAAAGYAQHRGAVAEAQRLSAPRRDEQRQDGDIHPPHAEGHRARPAGALHAARDSADRPAHRTAATRVRRPAGRLSLAPHRPSARGALPPYALRQALRHRGGRAQQHLPAFPQARAAHHRRGARDVLQAARP